MTITYAGPSVTSAFAAGLINDAWTTVTQLEAEASAAVQVLNGGKSPVVGAPIADSPLANKAQPVDMGFDANAAANDTDWNSRFAQLSADRSAIVGNIAQDAKVFCKTYFFDGLDGTGVFDTAEAWINTILLNGGSGVPYEQVLRTGDIARIINDSLRALQDANGAWAVRGVTLPARVVTYQTKLVGYATGDVLGAAERASRIHSWDTEVVQTRWAIEQATALRSGAMDRCRQFIVDWHAKRYDQATERSKEQIAKELELQDSYYKFMNYELGLRDVAIDRYLVGFDNQKFKWKNREELKDYILKLRLKALTNQLQALATRASAAINTIHVGAQATGSEQL